MTKNMLKTRRMMVLISTMTGKRLVNDSRTARKWLDKVGHFLAVLLVLLTVGVGNAWGKTVSLSIGDYAAANSWANDTKNATSIALNSDITVSLSGSTNTGKYYTADQTWRLYYSESASITISTSAGTLQSVYIIYSIKDGGTLKDGSTTVSSKALYSISGTSKTLTVDKTGDKTTAQVQIKAIAVTYSNSGAFYFSQISSASDLADGDEIIFVNQDETYACGTTQNTNNRVPVSISVTDHVYTYSNDDNVQVFTVKKNGSYFGFHAVTGYIYSASDKANNLKTNDTAATTPPRGTDAWTLSVENSIFTVQNVANTDYDLRFNGISYFSQYTTSSSSTKPYIYKAAYCYPLSNINGSVKTKSGTSVTLQWNDIANVTAWSVSGKDEDEVSVPALSIGTPSDEGSTYECVISNLTAGKEYTFTLTPTHTNAYCDDYEGNIIVVRTPKITTSTSSVTALSYAYGSGPSASKSFTVSGVGLTGNLTVTAPSKFEVSLDNSNWYSSRTLTPTSGTLSSTTVYVRLASGQSTGDHSGNVSISEGSASTVNVAVSGTVTAALSSIAVTTAPTKTVYLAGDDFNSSGMVVTATYSDATTDDITASCTFSPSTNLTAGTTSVTVTYSGKSTTQAITVYAITMQAKDEDGNAIAAGGPGTPTRSGMSISPADDAANYAFKQWNITGASLGSSSTTKSNTITSPTGAITVTAVYYKPITVTWKVGYGSASGSPTTQVKYGTAITALPTPPADNTLASCGPNKFMGWSKNELTGTGNSAPADLFTTAAGAGNLTSNTIYYAVFATESKASRSTIYEEPFKGEAGSNTDWANASSYFDDANTASITTTTSWKVSKYTTECSDNDGASGGSHMFCGSASGYIVFDFGDKSAYTDLVLSFNYRNNAAKDLARTISCTVSGDDGESWSDNIIDVASVTTQTWEAVSYNISNSSASALQVKYTATANNPSRVDDIKLTGCVTTYSNYITMCTPTFNAATDGNWSTASNWTSGSVPTIKHDVVIAKPVTVDITNAVAKSIVIDQSSTNTGKLTISAGKELVVAGTLTKTTDGETLEATEVDDLEFGSTLAAGTGALVMGSHDGTNQATVQFATKAYKNGNFYVNQYIGTPFNDETDILQNYYNSWIYAITYQDGVPGWNRRVDKGDGLNPFEGYDLMRPETTQNVVLSMEGTLVSSDDVTLTSSSSPVKLTYNGSSNTENVLANSWMAPIKIKAFEESDFTNMEATIYIFNAGSTDDVGKEGPAGNYSTYPIDKADATDVIPSMQSFSVYATAASPSLKLDYGKLVYDPAVAGLAVQPNFAPRRAKAAAMTSLKLHVAGESGFADELKVYVHDDFDEGFENGWDGHKMYGLDEAPQLYAVTNDGNMAVNCVPDAESMLIGLKAGTKDEQYTMTFEYEDAEPLYMVDTKTNTYTQVMTGNEYTFQTNDLGAHSRFILTHYAPQTPTDLEPTSDSSLKGRERGVKFIEGEKMFILMNGVLYDATGRRVEGVRE